MNQAKQAHPPEPAGPADRARARTAPAPQRTLHTFVAYVENVPGVLNRVTALFRRRAYNIDSLSVGRTETPGVSRMTIVLDADPGTARLLEANLYKLVNVLRVEDVSAEPTVMRDLALIKVRADADTRPKILQICEVFKARVVDMALEALIVEIASTEDKLQGLIEVLRPFGIIEMVRTGSIAMTRGKEPITVHPHFVSARVPTNRIF
ncbi:acetolactate synthase small subunit [Haliangium sp.]|uniref:acetolactate synthase small subunit n=1 Tax=Haliangium sp. TaxID=2663208 RepID=UPI003D0C9043